MDAEYRLKPVISQETASEKPNVTPISGSTPKPEKEAPKADLGPFSVEYFGIEGWGEMLLEPRLDVYGLAPKIARIEAFISEKCKELGAKETPESKKQILEQLEASLRISDLTKPHIRVDRINSIIDYMEQFETERKKRQFIIIHANKKK